MGSSMGKSLDNYLVHLHQQAIDRLGLNVVRASMICGVLWVALSSLSRVWQSKQPGLTLVLLFVTTMALWMLWQALRHAEKAVRATMQHDAWARVTRLLFFGLLAVDALLAAYAPKAAHALMVLSDVAALSTYAFLACNDPPPPRKRYFTKLKEQL